MTDPIPAPRRSPVLRNPGLVAVFAAILIVLFGAWQIYRSRDLAVAEAYHDLKNLNRSLAHDMERSLDAVDVMLGGVLRRVEAGAMAEPAAFKDFLTGHAKTAPQATDVSVFAADGHRLAASASDPAEAPTVADRAFFHWHSTHDDRAPRIGRRIASRVGGQDIVPVSRRWNRADGTFGGVVVAALDPDHFQRFHGRLDLGAQGVIAVIGDDRRFLMRYPHDPDLASRDLSRSPLFQDGHSRASEGLLRYRAIVDGVERIGAYAHLEDHPALVITARSLSEILAPWRREALLQGAALAVATSALVGLGLGLGRHERRAKAAEAAILSVAGKQREILDTANDAIVSVDSESRITAINRAAEAMLGWSAQEIIGQPVVEAIVPERLRADYGERIAAYLAAGSEAPTGNRIEMTGLRRDGTEFSMEVSATAAGASRSFNAFLRDISERKARETALADSEARYRVLAENASELILLGHDDGRRSYISPAAERLMGYTPDELAGMHLRDYVHPEDLPMLFAATARLGQGENQVQVAHRALHRTRGWVWVEGNFRRIPRTSGDEPTIVATFRDIGERVRYQEALEAAKDTAESANRAKTEFLASMSHEIRTPLNGVIGFTDIILNREILDPELRRQMELIRGSGSALLTIVNDILDFSKIEAGEIELALQAFSPTSLIGDAVAMVRGQADANGTAIVTDHASDVPDVLLGDPDRLRQILLNLLNNAVKFTRKGTVRITSTSRIVAGQSCLHVSVTDTGAGIPADKLGRLFQRFSQVDGSVQREYGGTGLGLAISKRLVELMGGEIGVESVHGRGATFWFEVPLPRLAAMPPAPEAVPASLSGISGRILVVDDIAMNLEIARAVLEAGGHRVDEAVDGISAIKAVAEIPYDLVLMDVQMPVLDGIAATRRIRALPGRGREVPILAMTANVLPEQVAAIRAAGMDGHIGKPFKRAELLDAVKRVLQAKELPEPEASPGDRAQAPDVHPEPLDRDVYDALREVIDPATIATLLTSFRRQITDGCLLDGPDDADPGRVAREAHALVSAAGVLGFMTLSDRCRDLEAALMDQGIAPPGLRDAVAKACREALDRLASPSLNPPALSDA